MEEEPVCGGGVTGRVTDGEDGEDGEAVGVAFIWFCNLFEV